MRKTLVVFLVIVLALSSAACSSISKSKNREYAEPENAEQALETLLSGNEKYLSGNITPNIDASLRADLATNGQNPYAIVITCSDSRVPAELIFDSSLGDIFVIRTAGNVVSDF